MASAISMRRTLQNAVLKIINDTVGPSATNVPYRIKTTDVHLKDRPIEDMPHVVVFVRQKELDGKEMGSIRELWSWQIHIYYLDISEDYTEGEKRRDKISDLIEVALSDRFNLDNAVNTLDTTGNTERVYDSDFSSVLYDSSGQEGYFTFVTEFYLRVDTQRN